MREGNHWLGNPQDASMEIWSPPPGLNLLLHADLAEGEPRLFVCSFAPKKWCNKA
jgi:hypothetical protein